MRVGGPGGEEAWTSWRGLSSREQVSPGVREESFHPTPVVKASGKWIRALGKAAEVTGNLLGSDAASAGAPGCLDLPCAQPSDYCLRGGRDSPPDSGVPPPQGREDGLTASEIPPSKGSLGSLP